MTVEIWRGEAVKISITVKNTGEPRDLGVSCIAASQTRVDLGCKSTGILSRGSDKTLDFYYTPTDMSETGYVDINAYVYENNDCTGSLLDSETKSNAVFVKFAGAKIVDYAFLTLAHYCNPDDGYFRIKVKNTGNVESTFYIFFKGIDPSSFVYNHLHREEVFLNPGDEKEITGYLWTCLKCQASHCYNMHGNWSVWAEVKDIDNADIAPLDSTPVHTVSVI